MSDFQVKYIPPQVEYFSITCDRESAEDLRSLAASWLAFVHQDKANGLPAGVKRILGALDAAIPAETPDAAVPTEADDDNEVAA